MPRFCALLLLLFCNTIVYSQTCTNTFTGTVIDLHDNSLLAGATVILAGSETAVQTDINGEFTFNNLCNSTYSFQVSHPFCATKGYTVLIDGDTNKTFKLEHHLEELNQVIIEGNAFASKTQTSNEQTLNTNDLEAFSSGSFGDALNSLSGVSTLSTGNVIVKPVVNGLHSSRVLIINNGVRMEDQEWGSEHAPNVDINSSGRVTLIKGANALQFGGDAVGGVIVTEASKIPVKDTLYGKTLSTLSSNGRGGVISSKLTKSFESGWFTSLQGTFKKYGDFESPDYILSNTGILERNFSVNAGLNRFDYGFDVYYSLFKNEIGILRASHLGGAQDQVRAIQSNEPLIINDFTYDINSPKQDVTHHLFRAKAFKKFINLGKLSLQYDYQFNNRLEFDVRRGDDKDNASLDLDLKTHTIKLDFESSSIPDFNIKAGILGRHQNNFANPDTGVRRLIPDYDAYNFGVYGTGSYNLNSKWLIDAGVRFDYTYIDVFKYYRQSLWESRGYDILFPELVIQTVGNQILVNPELHFNNMSATIGTLYEFNENYNASFNYALASRAPNPSELFSEGLHHSASRIELGDLRFTSEISQKLGLNFSKTKGIFRYTINPFLNHIKDFIVIEPTGVQQTVRGSFQVWEYRQTRAQLLGLDLDATLDLSDKWQFKHQFSLVKGYDLTREDALINMPPVNTQNAITYTNSKIKNLKLELQSDYNFRQNEFPNTNFDVFVAETQTSEKVDVSTPPAAYHLLNFKSSIDFNIKNNSIITVGLGVDNLFNTSYRNYLNRLRYYADDLGRNFLLNLKINY